MKICIVASSGISLLNFRRRLIKTLVENGNQVICISIEKKEELAKQISELGAEYYQVSGSRTDISLINSIRMISNYVSVFNKINPDMCFLYMSKPIAFGGYAAIKCKIKYINILVNGLENAFYRTDIKSIIVRTVMSIFYWYVSHNSDNVFFQNQDDYNYFINKKLSIRSNACIVNGSGVDMEWFSKEVLPEKPIFLMISRLLWSKGIREYLDSIMIVKEKYPQIHFMLVGGLDDNDEALSYEDLKKCINKYDIEYYGYTKDVRPYLKRCSIFVLPSYHEGTPRCILEAMATGRPILTTDAPGCRETVLNGINGFLVPVRDSITLSERMMQLIEDDRLRLNMAEQSYTLCLEKYEISKVNKFMISKMIREENVNVTV